MVSVKKFYIVYNRKIFKSPFDADAKSRSNEFSWI